MKRPMLVLGLAIVFGLVGIYFWHNQATLFFVLAQGDCCDNVPLQHPTTARFPQGAQVTVYIDSSPSGFTDVEQTLIRSGIEDWNDEPNNSGVTYQVVITSSPPPAGTNNTIVVRFSNQFSSGTGGMLLNMHSGSGPSGTSIYGEMIFFNNIRDPQRQESKPEQIRSGARHEIAHGIGLANADDCPVGSTIMNPSWTQETFITDCDNNAINSDPNYPAPTPSPSPTPTPCAELNQSCFFDSDCCAGTRCGNESFVCISCEPNPQSQETCMSETCRNCYGQGGTYCTEDGGNCWTPIVVDVLGNGFNLTNVTGGVNFNDGFGTILRTAWTNSGSDDAWLVLDRNGNGTIDDGTELFGNATPQPPPTVDLRNGFTALNEFDKATNGGNQDGLISREDSIFTSLRLWQDIDHDGISSASELHSLPKLGIVSIDLEYKTSKYKDGNGNTFRFRAKLKDAQGVQLGRWAYDVFLAARRAE